MSLAELKGKDFINLEDFTSKQIIELVDLGIKLKKKTKNKLSVLFVQINLYMVFFLPTILFPLLYTN